MIHAYIHTYIHTYIHIYIHTNNLYSAYNYTVYDTHVVFILLRKIRYCVCVLLLLLFCFVRCKFRVLDSFGTEAQFNYAGYNEKVPGGNMGQWGRHNLNLRQYMTMFRKFTQSNCNNLVAVRQQEQQ